MQARRALVFLLLVAGCASAPPPSGSAPARLRTGMLEVPDGSLYYEVAGEGPPVVLIHGGFGDRRMRSH